MTKYALFTANETAIENMFIYGKVLHIYIEPASHETILPPDFEGIEYRNGMEKFFHVGPLGLHKGRDISSIED